VLNKAKAAAAAALLAAGATAALADGMPEDAPEAVAPQPLQGDTGGTRHEHPGGRGRHGDHMEAGRVQMGMQSHGMAGMRHEGRHRKGGGC
jgi:hypothetical protein